MTAETIIVVGVNIAVLVLVGALFLNLIADLLCPWPTPREHHAFHCPECPCSYEGAAELARHHVAQHTDGAVLRMPVDGGPAR
jgi:hypothetical protein